MNTLKKINELQKFGSKLGLERMNRLLDLLGNPREGLKYIHVGGTNGKGSVCNYVYSILKENGYKVGLFTSPFMDGFRQAIIVDDEVMTEKQLDEYYQQIEHAMELMKEEGFDSPTEFEVITALALMYFESKQPDFVILEVGLGGIGDSTNVIHMPVVSVITSIALDHCDVLGDTIEAIAREKAGIIKKGVPVISNAGGEGAKIIAREAYKKEAPLIDASKYKATGVKVTSKGSKFSVYIDGISYPDMEVSMPGRHQVNNGICALTVIELLRKKAMISLDKEKTQRGLKNAGLEGRFEIIGGNPLIILDGAHNGQGAKALADTIDELYPDKKILTVFSLMKDKDPINTIREFVRYADTIIIADVLDDKKIDTTTLLDTTNILLQKNSKSNYPVAVKVETNRSELLSTIKKSTDFDIVLVTGSLYLIRDIRKDLANPV